MAVVRKKVPAAAVILRICIPEHHTGPRDDADAAPGGIAWFEVLVDHILRRAVAFGGNRGRIEINYAVLPGRNHLNQCIQGDQDLLAFKAGNGKRNAVRGGQRQKKVASGYYAYMCVSIRYDREISLINPFMEK